MEEAGDRSLVWWLRMGGETSEVAIGAGRKSGSMDARPPDLISLVWARLRLCERKPRNKR